MQWGLTLPLDTSELVRYTCATISPSASNTQDISFLIPFNSTDHFVSFYIIFDAYLTTLYPGISIIGGFRGADSSAS